jgi:hypothetical protein
VALPLGVVLLKYRNLEIALPGPWNSGWVKPCGED